MKYAMLKIPVVLSALAAGFIFGNNRKCDCAGPFYVPHRLFFEKAATKAAPVATVAGTINPGQNNIWHCRTRHVSESNFNMIENAQRNKEK